MEALRLPKPQKVFFQGENFLLEEIFSAGNVKNRQFFTFPALKIPVEHTKNPPSKIFCMRLYGVLNECTLLQKYVLTGLQIYRLLESKTGKS